MPGQRLPMHKIHDMLRLSAGGMSKRKIAASLGVSLRNVRARKAGETQSVIICLTFIPNCRSGTPLRRRQW